VLDNVDPTTLAALLDLLGPGLRRTLFNVISKSGETAETAAQFLIVRELVARRLGVKALPRQILVTTDAASGTLRAQAQRDGYETLSVPDGVGGRFSVLSAVGLFSAAMCGIDAAAVMAGAAEMGLRVANPRLRENPAAIVAALHYLFYQRGKRLHVMMPYSARLKDLADWHRQLWAESLGKRRDLQGRDVFIGPTPIKALGATDQHSQVQLYREGPNDKVFTFLVVDEFDRDVPIPVMTSEPPTGAHPHPNPLPSREREAQPAPQREAQPAAHAGGSEATAYLSGASLGRLLNAEQAATEYALVQAQRPCLTVRFERITPQAVGAFFMLYEAATSIAGLLFGIDAYNQPAVQAGKDGTFALMGRRGHEALAKQILSAAQPDPAYEV
jgi:glucose-6-phosphate isomerase